MDPFLRAALAVIALQYVWFFLGILVAMVTRKFSRDFRITMSQPDTFRHEPLIVGITIAVALAIGVPGMFNAFWAFELGAMVSVFLGNHFMHVGRYYR